ncbi:MAG: alcohol dehydrogenase catalytic domain-containing protein [Ignavibacteriaceae bacterium]
MNINSFAAHKPKDDLVPFVYEPKSLAAHEVLVKITHCGICHSDIHLIDNDWMVSKYPLVPGHEIVGLVIGWYLKYKFLSQ